MINLIKGCMLHCVLFFVLTVSIFSAKGQASLGLHATLNEYAGDLNSDHYHFYNFSFPEIGAAISLQHDLTPSFNLVEKFSFDQVQFQNSEQEYGVDADFYTLNVLLKYKFNNDIILKERAVIAPFITLGIGGAYVESQNFTWYDNTEQLYVSASDGTKVGRSQDTLAS